MQTNMNTEYTAVFATQFIEPNSFDHSLIADFWCVFVRMRHPRIQQAIYRLNGKWMIIT